MKKANLCFFAPNSTVWSYFKATEVNIADIDNIPEFEKGQLKATKKAIFCFFTHNSSAWSCFMATEVNIADMSSITEIYLWVPTTLPHFNLHLSFINDIFQ